MTEAPDRDLRTVGAGPARDGSGPDSTQGLLPEPLLAERMRKATRRKMTLLVVGGLVTAGVVYLFVVVLHKPVVPVVAGMVLAHFLMHSGHKHDDSNSSERRH